MEDWQSKLIREALIWGMGIVVARVFIGLLIHRLEQREAVSKRK